jgi:hypothetical protein
MYLDELWEFNFNTLRWKQISSSESDNHPERRCYHSAIELPGTDCMIVYGGSNGNHLNDVWLFDALKLTWTNVNVISAQEELLNELMSGSMKNQMLVDETIPAARAKHSAIALSHDTFIVHGGTTGLFRESDLWLFKITNMSELDGEGNFGNLQGEWIRLDTPINAQIPVPRDSHTISLVSKEIWLFGGSGKGTYFNDLWSMSLERVLTEPSLTSDPPPKRLLRVEMPLDEEEEIEEDEEEREENEFDEFQLEAERDDMEDEIINRLSEALHLEEIKQRQREEDQQRQIEQEEEEERRREEEQEHGILLEEERKRIEKQNAAKKVYTKPLAQPKKQYIEDLNASAESNLSEFSVHLEQQLVAHRKETEDVRELLSQLKSIKQSEEQQSLQTTFNLNDSEISAVYDKRRDRLSNGTSSKRDQDYSELYKQSTIAVSNLQLMIKERIRNEDLWRKSVDTKMQRFEECMMKQGEALEALTQVVSKEIESRVAGENRSQKYYQLLYQQISTQTKQQLSNSNQYSDILSTLSGSSSSSSRRTRNQ